MATLSLIFIAVMAIVLVTSSKDGETFNSAMTVPSTPLQTDYILYRQQPKSFVASDDDCTDENCLSEKQDKHGIFPSYNEDMAPPPIYGHEYDWARSELTDFENNVLQKRGDDMSSLDIPYAQQYSSSCACETKYEVKDLGYGHYPRLLVTATCQNRNLGSRKCWRGSRCKEIPYKVRVLTHRPDNEPHEQDRLAMNLPESLRNLWKLKTITIASACQCAI